MSVILYSYWRSSAAYRVRIALNYLNIEHEIRSVGLVQDGGEQHRADYRALNPQGLVPTLIDGKTVLTQSLAILEYLAEKHASPRLLPRSRSGRARARQMANLICTDIHPLNNLRVLQYLENTLHVNKDARMTWYRHWLAQGFRALEQLVQEDGGPYCLGKEVSIADLCLVPQMYNAHRFRLPLEDYPILTVIEEECLQLAAFDRARPENQPDAQ